MILALEIDAPPLSICDLFMIDWQIVSPCVQVVAIKYKLFS